jgi:hypothetical protein
MRITSEHRLIRSFGKSRDPLQDEVVISPADRVSPQALTSPAVDGADVGYTMAATAMKARRLVKAQAAA